MGNVIHRGKGSFTFVENTIFFDHGLSAKAKGIYCQIRSLENNPEWVFTIKGFASLVRDGADGARKKIVVETFDGAPVLSTPFADVLQKAGFVRLPDGMRLYVDPFAR